MNIDTPQKMQLVALIPGWIAVALIGFLAYLEADYMKFFLVMNLLMLAYTMIVLDSWIRKKLKD